MSKRTLRRAAERQVRKANRDTQPTSEFSSPETLATPLFTDPTTNPLPDFVSEPADRNDKDLAWTSEERAFGERYYPDLMRDQDELEAKQKFLDKILKLGTTRPQPAANPESTKPESSEQTTTSIEQPPRSVTQQGCPSWGRTNQTNLLEGESSNDLGVLTQTVYAEYKPETGTEQRLANSLIRHYWLKERAIHLQERLIERASDPLEVDSKKLALFLRYQTVHERSYYKAERELRNIMKEKQKGEIGFESQNRKTEAHEARVRLTHARARNLEIDTACRQVMEAPIPGNEKIGFEQLTHACSVAIANVVYQNQSKTAESNG